MKNKLTTLVFVVMTIISTNAQVKQELKFGFALPQGTFKNVNDFWLETGDGCARTGFALNYKLMSPFKIEGLYFMADATIVFNDLERNFKMDLKDNFENNNSDRFSLPKYLNFPLLLGAHYEKAVTNEITLFGNAGVGANFFKITNLSREINQQDYKQTTKFNTAVRAGYKIGFGAYFKGKYFISMDYLGLGSHRVEYTTTTEYSGQIDNDSDRLSRTMTVGSLNFSVGIRF
jgi:hypothetical protein